MQPLVDAWRAANPHIVRFWNALGNAASEVIERQNSVRVGKVTVYRKEGHLLIRLPGGRDPVLPLASLCDKPLRQPGHRLSRARGKRADDAAGKPSAASSRKTCTQSIARDLLAHAMLSLETAGYPIVFHVHDEAVMEVPRRAGQRGGGPAASWPSRRDWARDLPLRAEGDEMAYYKKT